jgi:hypothetical protein
MMDAWEEQIKSPNPSAMLSKLKSLPSFGSADVAASNPLQLYMQFAEQCQKAWADAAGFWSKAGKSFSS